MKSDCQLMTELCHDVQVEPHLYVLSNEAKHHRSAVLDNNIVWILEHLVIGGAYIIVPF